MEVSTSFHIPAPNDDLKNISEIVSIVSSYNIAEESILWEISQISIQWVPNYIRAVEKVLHSEDPDALLGAPLDMVVSDNANTTFQTNGDAKKFLEFVLEGLKMHLQKYG
ncbi:MAG TPA: hypothetical protein VFS21_37320 [Roseiflexaceae bacterium]|nr:hypothetical protein [Roseiflexaceae bacterium]